MRCQSCSAKATVHLTDIEADGQKRELHLCEACAQKKNLIHKQEINVQNILQTLIGAHVGSWTEELSRMKCPICGIKYMEFRSEGRLGCPHDYEVFRMGLEPLLQRIHRSGHHIGKSPRHHRDTADRQKELLTLRRQLKEAIDEEAYERAAKLRDMIRQKEAQP